MGIIATLIIGALAGWLAGKLFQGRGFGLIGNIVVGIIGSLAGYGIAGFLGLDVGDGWIMRVLVGAGGAIVLLFIIGLFSGKKA
jgi:uncharacterized membrane protein YeaQ/YmgE (transglycosylase-associated protein family)